MQIKKRAMCCAIAMATMGAAHAGQDDASASDMFSFSGFGTVGVMHSTAKEGDFKTDSTVPSGSGRSHNWAVTQMSRIGAQVDAKFSDQFSAAIQAVSEYNYDNSYAPQITSAFVRYDATPTLAFRAGRLPLPIYMLTDVSRVGYAMPWVRPPFEMYIIFPSFDGADAVLKSRLGDVALTTQVYAGRMVTKKRDDPTWNVEKTTADITGITVTGDIGASTFRIGHLEGPFTIQSAQQTQVLDGYRSPIVNFFYPGAAAVADKYDTRNKVLTYDSIGYTYDPGSWFLRTEIGKLSWKNRTIAPAASSGYVSAGYRMGEFTPFATWGYVKQDSAPTLGSEDMIGYINTAMQAAEMSRHSVSVGVRWDFRPNMDFKLQLSRITRDSKTSNNGLSYLSTAAPASYSVIAAGIDFVF